MLPPTARALPPFWPSFAPLHPHPSACSHFVRRFSVWSTVAAFASSDLVVFHIVAFHTRARSARGPGSWSVVAGAACVAAPLLQFASPLRPALCARTLRPRVLSSSLSSAPSPRSLRCPSAPPPPCLSVAHTSQLWCSKGSICVGARPVVRHLRTRVPSSDHPRHRLRCRPAAHHPGCNGRCLRWW